MQQKKHPPLKKRLRLVVYLLFISKKLTFYIRKRVSKRLMMKIIFGLRKRFLEKHLTSLNVQMEVMMTTHLKKSLRLVVYLLFISKKLTFYIRKRVSKRLMTKIIFGLRKRFLKKDLASLNVQMEVMMTTHQLMSTPATNRQPPKSTTQKSRRALMRVPRLSSVSVREHESVSKLS